MKNEQIIKYIKTFASSWKIHKCIDHIKYISVTMEYFWQNESAMSGLTTSKTNTLLHKYSTKGAYVSDS